jgi:hypothetical protein
VFPTRMAVTRWWCSRKTPTVLPVVSETKFMIDLKQTRRCLGMFAGRDDNDIPCSKQD